jgi:hypothetical protein
VLGWGFRDGEGPVKREREMKVLSKEMDVYCVRRLKLTVHDNCFRTADLCAHRWTMVGDPSALSMTSTAA